MKRAPPIGFRAWAVADAYLIPRIADARRTSEARDDAAITQHAACDHLRGARGVSRDAL